LEFVENFMDYYHTSTKILGELLDKTVIEDRIFRNWIIILASYRTLAHHLALPFTEKELFFHAHILIVRQNAETKKSNELSTFWSIIEFLVNDGLLKEGVDFRIEYCNSLKTDTLNAHWTEPKNLVFVNHSRLFQLYRTHGSRSQEKLIPLSTLEYYLQHCKEYLGRKTSVAFKVEENKRIVEDFTETCAGIETKKRKITTAMVFDYDKLGINLSTTTIKDEEETSIFKAQSVKPF
jgi:hypothetical protein